MNQITTANSRLKQFLIGGFRLLFSLSLISIIIWKVGIENTLNRLSLLNLYYLSGAACLIFLTFLLHTIRWMTVLSSSGYSWHLSAAFREIWVGYFFNQLLPSSVGGDGIRTLRLYRSQIPLGASIRSILGERIFGLMACVFLSVAAIPIMFLSAPASPVTLVVEITTLLGLAGSFVLLRPNSLPLSLLPTKFVRELHILSGIIKSNNHFVRMIIISVGMQICIASAVALLSLGLTINANPLLMATLFQPVTLITILPISLAGWGIREGALIAVLSTIGVASTDALPLSLAFGATLLVTSMPGWFCFHIAISPPKSIQPTNTMP